MTVGLYRTTGKRLFDIVAAGSALLVLSPVLLVVASAIVIDDRGRVIFRQQRVGRHGKPFLLFKFRSMPVDTGDLPSDAARHLRITRVGRILRRSNIDELPQLVNILRGDMSVVGPRPALPAQQQLTDLRRRNGALACRPGLTGLAQVNAYDGMPVEEKAEWDARYAGRITFARDLGIILRTVRYLASPPPAY